MDENDQIAKLRRDIEDQISTLRQQVAFFSVQTSFALELQFGLAHYLKGDQHFNAIRFSEAMKGVEAFIQQMRVQPLVEAVVKDLEKKLADLMNQADTTKTH